MKTARMIKDKFLEAERVRVTEMVSKRHVNTTKVKYEDFLGPKQKMFGAFNGITGILYMLVKSCLVVEDLQEDDMMMDAIEISLLRLIKLMGKTGKLPLRANSKEYRVDFNCGSPGTIPLFIEAMKLFPQRNKEFIEMAESVGELMWKEGLLRAGKGLASGISGNGYMFHSLYRVFKIMEES